MVSIDPSVYILAALYILILPTDWLSASVIAALVHEFGHIAVLLFLKGNIRAIHLGRCGCIIETDRLGLWQEILSLVAGPLGSLSLILIFRKYPRIALCGTIQGLYNLIPVLPLDGGRILRFLMDRVWPEHTDLVLRIIEWCIWGVSAVLTIWFIVFFKKYPMLIIAAVIWNIRFLHRKIPCKPSGIRVQ